MQINVLQVMKKIVAAEVHRLVVTDHDNHCVGMISLSDILSFLVLTQLGKFIPILARRLATIAA